MLKLVFKSWNFNWTRRTHLKSWIKLVSNRPIFNSCPIQMGNRVRQIWKSNQFHENYGETVKTEVPASRRFDEFFLPSFFAKSKKMESCKSFVGGLFLKCYCLLHILEFFLTHVISWILKCQIEIKICIRRLVGSTDQACSSDFYFRIAEKSRKHLFFFKIVLCHFCGVSEVQK